MEDYIKYIRKLVGHKEIMAIGVTCLILNENDEILIEERSDNHLFCLPGGALNYEENVLDGLKREIKEETGINLFNPQFIGIYSGKDSTIYYPNNDITNYVVLAFIEKINKQKINPLDNESINVSFKNINEIDFNKLLKNDYKILTRYKNGLINEMEVN